MKLRRTFRIPLIALLLVLASCGLVRRTGSAVYRPGEPESPGYTPIGSVEQHFYPSTPPGPAKRRMIVYLPQGYYSTPLRSYPVCYLLHGARGYETSWITKGKMLQLADSLFAGNLAAPCIIVMPNMNQYDDDADCDGGRFKDAFESIFEIDGVTERNFMHDVVHFVDSVYRTLPGPENRAVAGLSIGGHQSLHIAARHAGEFGYVGAFSPYFWTMGKASSRRTFYSPLRSRTDSLYAVRPPEELMLTAGKLDIMRPSTGRFHGYLSRRGYNHDYIVSPGGHEWRVWRKNFVTFLEKAFRQDEDTVRSE